MSVCVWPIPTVPIKIILLKYAGDVSTPNRLPKRTKYKRNKPYVTFAYIIHTKIALLNSQIILILFCRQSIDRKCKITIIVCTMYGYILMSICCIINMILLLNRRSTPRVIDHFYYNMFHPHLNQK